MHPQIQPKNTLMQNDGTTNLKGGDIMDSRIALAANTQLNFNNKEGGAV